MAALSLASGAMQAYGQVRAGNQAAAAGEYNRQAAYNEAKGLDIQAGQEIAVASHNTERIAQRAKEIMALQQARGAAGGQSTSDATVNVIADETVKRSTLDQLLEMVSAEERAQQLRHKANVTRTSGEMSYYDGKRKQSASRLMAATTLASSAASAYGMAGFGSQPTGWAAKFGDGMGDTMKSVSSSVAKY